MREMELCEVAWVGRTSAATDAKAPNMPVYKAILFHANHFTLWILEYLSYMAMAKR